MKTIWRFSVRTIGTREKKYDSWNLIKESKEEVVEKGEEWKESIRGKEKIGGKDRHKENVRWLEFYKGVEGSSCRNDREKGRKRKRR